VLSSRSPFRRTCTSICSSCGQVTEFANDRLERMIALLAEEVAFRPHHHRLEIYGLCRSCQQANPLARTR